MTTDTATEGRRAFDVTFGHFTQKGPWTDRRRLFWEDLVRELTVHGIGDKVGTCLVPAIFSGDSRKKGEAAKIDVAFLDSDAGFTLEEIERAVREHGWAAIISSTHSHLTTRTTAKASNYEKFCARRGGELDADSAAAEFLTVEKGYLPRVVEGAAVVTHADDEIVFEHQPCPKFRVAVPLARSWRAADYGDQDIANAVWKGRIEALAAALHLNHDQACTDTSRLFYLPRRPKNGPSPEILVLDGANCDIFALAEHDGTLFGHTAATAEARRQHREADAGTEFADPETGEVFDLSIWARTHGHLFEIVKALRARRLAAFVGHVADRVKHHIRCSNEGEHTQAGEDAATFIVNASDADNRGFVYHCRHAHCDGRDRLLFVRRMLEQGWLGLDDLTDPAFLVSTDEGAPRGRDDGFRAPPKGKQAAGRQQEKGPTWQGPIDILAEDELTGVPLLRPDHVPPALWGFIQDTAERMGVDPASLALTAIVTCAAVVTDEWEIQPKRLDTTWSENPRLWGATIGDPSVLKSPVLRACTRVVDAIEMRVREAHDEDMRRYKADHKRWKDEKGDAVDEPRRPRRIRYIVEGTTVEALSEVLRTDDEAKFRTPARKVLVRQDELAEWLASFDRYKSGGSGSADRGAYLKLFNGDPNTIDRVIRGSFTVPHWSACIVGGIQPEVIRRVAEDAHEDGLLQRFLFCVPGPTVQDQDRPPDTAALNRYRDLIEALTALTPPTSSLGQSQPRVVLHADAHAHRESINDLARALSGMPDATPQLKAAYGKWRGIWARLALTFHLIEIADARTRGAEIPLMQVLSEATARMAAAYMEEILHPHMLRAYALMYRTPQTQHARWIAGFILAQGKDRVTVRDVTRAYGALRPPEKRRELGSVMDGLVTIGWLLPEQPDLPPYQQAGWLVNPLVLERFKARGEEERERRKCVREEMTALIRNRVKRRP